MMVVACGTGVSRAAESDRATARPHIVVVLSDDHGWLDSSPYGSEVVQTPHLQRLADAGTLFTHVFVGSPSCVPSRAVIMSGLLPARNGAQANHTQLREGVRTLPTYLAALDYRVVHFGKSHFQPRAQYAEMEFVPSEVKGGPLNNDLDTQAFDEWLATRDSADLRPLCLIVCPHSPHVYWPENDGYDPERVELPPSFVDTPETRRWRTRYYTDITKLDRQVGAVYDSVRDRLGDNTLFIYTSDHGAQFPFAKWNLYDAGLRVPFIAVWPGVIEPGGSCDALISSADYLPTFVELAGGVPSEGLDGVSFVGVLRGAATKHRTHVLAAHSGDGDMNVYPMRCVRSQRYKYILNLHPEYEYTTHIDKGSDPDGREFWRSWERAAESSPAAAQIVQRYHRRPPEELYDVESDPHELHNLAGSADHADLLSQMRSQLRDWMTEHGDEGPTFGTPRLLKED
jgi:uncharacterized sulfatase